MLCEILTVLQLVVGVDSDVLARMLVQYVTTGRKELDELLRGQAASGAVRLARARPSELLCGTRLT